MDYNLKSIATCVATVAIMAAGAASAGAASAGAASAGAASAGVTSVEPSTAEGEATAAVGDAAVGDTVGRHPGRRVPLESGLLGSRYSGKTAKATGAGLARVAILRRARATEVGLLESRSSGRERHSRAGCGRKRTRCGRRRVERERVEPMQ